MNKDWLFADDKYICGLRTAGVVIKDNMILVQRDKDGNDYALPGGHIKIGETSEAALVRKRITAAWSSAGCLSTSCKK